MKKQNISTTNEIWTIFGERLKTELERQGISLRQFAVKAGLTLNTACRYAHSQRTPRATEILKAAEVLHVTCDYMLGLSDDPHKSAQPDLDEVYAHAETEAEARFHAEIVRCKDCKHFKRNIPCVGGFYDGCDELSDNGNEMFVDENFYCGYAERRTDG